MSYQSDLYKQVILDHNKNPKNKRQMKEAEQTHSCEGHNPLCGDSIELYIRLGASGEIEDISFEGDGCAISKASTSMMTVAVKGIKVEEARVMFEEFHKMILGEFDPYKGENHLGRLKIFKGVSEFPSRTKCATLPWHTLVCALEDKKSTTTE